MNKELPNFFIVGAPKCGTTALSRYLGEHTHVFMSQPKEPYYFADDFPRLKEVLSGIDTYEKYMNLFRTVSDEHIAVGEASTVYLFSSKALKNIRNFNPEARIIAMVRNPVELVYSFHSQLLRFCIEDEKDFEAAWRLQEARRSGQYLPPRCLDEKLLQYAEWGKLGDQVERLLRIFSSEQVKIIVFDDFVDDTQATYNSVLAFLNVPSNNRTQFPRVNANARYRFPQIKMFFLKLRRQTWYKDLAKRVKAVVDLHPYRWFNRLNKVEVERDHILREFRQELVAGFRADIDKLSRLIDRDLDHWLK
jgi:hypothetical protein